MPPQSSVASPSERMAAAAISVTKGKVPTSMAAEFGEKVWYRPLHPGPASRRPAAESRFELGCFPTFAETSNEVLVVSATGQVLKAKTLRRLPQSHRWDRDWLLRVTGTEIQPNPGEFDTRIAVRLDPSVAHDVAMPRPEPAPPRTRGVKLFEGDFWAAGFTDHCRGCELIGQGSTQHKVHSPACRRRMEEYLATSADGRRRLQAAAERQATSAPTEMEAEDDEPLTTMPEVRWTQSDATEATRATPGSASSGVEHSGAAGRIPEAAAVPTPIS